MSARQLKPRPKIDQTAPIFAALGDETRLRLVARLCKDGPMSIARLTAGSSVTRQAVTKHLHVLASVGLASSSPSGRERVWEFEPAPLDAARQCLDRISEQWDGALDRLKKFVED
ncbi:MAG: metalloregulator ArsR/SmtB family transcription factor [Bryobacteraceae bacterium]|jgi:DNA-binding transcriptional ArsR family regulator